jgi:hypothetical protein
MLPVEQPFKTYTGIDGKPLNNGSVYFGQPGQDPITHPVTVYWDAAGTLPAAQPLRTVNGYIVNDSGAAANPFYDSSYSTSVIDSKGVQVFYAPSSDSFSVSTQVNGLFKPGGSSLVPFIQAGTGAVSRQSQAKMRDHVHIRDFGAVCDGATDDTAAINAALAAAIEVWVDGTPLITSTITVPAHKKIRFKGGLGNTQNSYPTSYLIKAASMTTVGLKLLDCAHVDGGGLVCQAGNTGDGVQLAGNSAKLSHFLVHGSGGVGVRVGTDTGNNTNFCRVDQVVAQWTGGHAFYVHDGVGSDCNAARLTHCFAQHTGGDGIRLGHTWWTMVDSGLSEVCTGSGLYLSGTNNGGYPECRWATILGGDYNEGNGAVITDASYFPTILNADFSQAPSTPSNGLQGSAIRSYVGGMYWQIPGFNAGPYQCTFKTNGSTDSPIKVAVNGTGSVGDGAGITFTTYLSGTPHDAAIIKAWNATTNVDGLDFQVNKLGTMTSIVKVTSYYNGISSSVDNTYNVGHPAARFGTVYAGTATINTSDAREKQQIQDIDAAALRAVRRIPFKQFKFNDAVELKADGARWHFGVLAQDVKAAFEAEGLDPFAYGVLCYDEWTELTEPVMAERQAVGPDGQPQTDLDGAPVMETYDTGEQRCVQTAGNRYGVRHDELYALKLAAIEASACDPQPPSPQL